MADIDNLYILARRAKDEGNTENAAKYYSQIVEIAPNDPEAYFYSVYYRVSNCKIGEIGVAANRLKAAFISTVQLLKSNDSITSGNVEILTPYAEAMISLACTLSENANNHYKNNRSVSGVLEETNGWILNCVKAICEVGDVYYEFEDKNNAIYCYQKADNITYGQVDIPYNALSRIKEVKTDYITIFQKRKEEIQKQKEESEQRIAEMTKHTEEIKDKLVVLSFGSIPDFV